MSNIDKRALREAAEKATPGRWEYYPGNTSIEYNVDSMDEDQGSIVYVDSGDFTQKQTDLNGGFIAAANPTTVLALLDELESEHAKSDGLANTLRIVNASNAEMAEALEAAEKRIAELEARDVKPVAWLRESALKDIHTEAWTPIIHMESERMGADLTESYGVSYIPLYTAPPSPVSVHESVPVAYIFKHPAGRLFWSLTDEINKGQSDVMPVYSAPVPAFVPPAIEPDYEVIKGILPTANPDEYACCIAADMWNACRAAMLQGAENAESTTTIQTAPDLDSLPKIAESPSGNSPVIPDGWKLVPVEPTMSQELAGYRTLTDTGKMSRLMKTRLSNIYRAMIAAAPQQEVK